MENKKSTAWLWIVIVIVILVIVGYFASRPTTPTEKGAEAVMPTEPVKIGGILPLTGEGAAYGLPLQKAAQIAIDEINAAGGIAGQPLEVIWEDGKCEPEAANSAANKLINVNGVKFILSGACSSEALSIAPLAEEKQVVCIGPSVTSPDLTEAGDYFFRNAPSDALAGQIAAEYAYKTLGFAKAAIISENKDYTQGLRKIFREKFLSLGGEVAVDEVYNPGDTDFRTQILKVKDADVKVIYVLPQAPASGILLAKQLKENGVEAQLLHAEVLIGREVAKENAELLEGLIGVEGYFDPTNSPTVALAEKYKAETDEEMPFPFYMGNAYDIFYIFKEAIEKVGLDSTAVKDYLYTIKDRNGAGGSLTFDTNGDPLTDYNVMQIQDGEVVSLEIYKPSR